MAVSTKNLAILYRMVLQHFTMTVQRSDICYLTKMVDYEAPFKTVKNADGEWIPFEFSLLLLNSSDVVLDKRFMLICRRRI